MITLTFLGTGGAISQGRAYTSILVNNSILFDVAPTAPFHLSKMQKDFTAINHVFVTHFHGDHTFGLPFLLLEYAFAAKRKTPLVIVGSGAIKEFTESLVESAYPDAADHILGQVPIEYISIPKEGGDFNLEGISGIALPMSHGNIATFGYSLKIGNNRVAFSGDTGLCENLLKLIESSDIVIVECSFLTTVVPGHMNIEDIKEIKMILQRSDKEKKLILVHLGKEVEPFKLIRELPGVVVPDDLEEYTF